jgi:hypothetical protein
LSSVVFRCVVRHHKDPDRHVLIGMRTKEPAKGTFFVPGGIRKNETLANAFARIIKSETGLKASLRRKVDGRLRARLRHQYARRGWLLGTEQVILRVFKKSH